MKLFVIAVFVSLGVLVSARSIEQYTPEEENFALGVDEHGHALGEPMEDDAGETKLDPMAKCLWDWLKCWNANPKNANRCAQEYENCIERAKEQARIRKLANKCLWDLLVCWNKREISSSKCGFIYSDCIKDAKKGIPSTEAPSTDLPPPPIPDE